MLKVVITECEGYCEECKVIGICHPLIKYEEGGEKGERKGSEGVQNSV